MNRRCETFSDAGLSNTAPLTAEQVAAWLRRFSPVVGWEPYDAPASLYLDITGVAHLFQGEEPLAGQLVSALESQRLPTRVAIADTPGAAWALAHYGPLAAPRETPEMCQPLARRSGRSWIFCLPAARGELPAVLKALPLESLRLPREIVTSLRELGLRRVEQLASAPRAGLAARFGPSTLQRLDQLAGRLDEVIVAYRPPPVAAAEISLEFPTDRRDALEHLLARLFEQVLRRLPARQGVQRLVCRFQRPGAEAVEMEIGLFRATAETRHLERLAQMRLESLRLPGPVSAVRVEVLAAGRLEFRQTLLFEETDQEGPRRLAMLVDCLSARLGEQRVSRVRLQADAQPEYGWRYEPLVSRALPGAQRPAAKRRKSRRAAAPAPAVGVSAALCRRPLWLYSPPLRLDVTSLAPHGPPARFLWRRADGRADERWVRAVWGPERIETGWWRGRMSRRDYYRVETHLGEWFWLFRRLQDGKWFLHGAFC